MIKLKMMLLRNKFLVPSHFKSDAHVLYFMINVEDKRNFFVTFVLCKLDVGIIEQYISYLPENYILIENNKDSYKYKNRNTPHSIIKCGDGDKFLCFMEDEEYFFLVDLANQVIVVHTMNDFFYECNSCYKIITSTAYEDYNDSRYFYLAVVDDSEMLHIFKVKNDLSEFLEVDCIKSNQYPPHVIRNIKTKLYLSHEFKYSNYYSKNKDEYYSNDETAKIFELGRIRAGAKYIDFELFSKLNEKLQFSCVQGEISAIDIEKKAISYYNTTGGSPAHFEIDNSCSL